VELKTQNGHSPLEEARGRYESESHWNLGSLEEELAEVVKILQGWNQTLPD